MVAILHRTGLAGIVSATLLASACGRSPLSLGGGGVSNSSVVVAASTSVDATTGTTSSGPLCASADLSTWKTERFRDGGDYERAVAAVSGVPWVAFKPRGGDLFLAELAIDPVNGIVVRQRIDVPGADVYPAAFDIDDQRAVLLTASDVNFNGNAELWRIDRVSGDVKHLPVGAPPANPAFTIGAALGLVGDHIAVAYSRLADNQGTIDIRDDQLGVLTSMSIDEASFAAVRTSPSTFDFYAGSKKRVRVDSTTMTVESVDPAWETVGGLDTFVVQLGTTVRMSNGTTSWDGMWPDTQVSPPAVVRTHAGDAVFSLETELSAVVGHVKGNSLDWLRVDSVPDAPGFGANLMPLFEDGRIGVFYLGLEIPSPVQPLRYYGLACTSAP